MSKIKSLLLNTVLFCVVTVLLAGAGEAALRVAGIEALGYVTPEVYGNVNLLYRPNSQTRWRGNMGQAREFDTPVRTNSIVQFDREHAVEKPAGVYRVVVAGDSFVEALQVPLEKGFAHLLEEALNRDPDIVKTGRRVEVIKLGSSGNGALKTYEALERNGFEYRPDLVLFFFTDTNDFNDDWYYFRRQTGLEPRTHVNLVPPKTSYDKIVFYNQMILFPGSRLNRWIAFQATQWREKRNRQKDDAQSWKDSLGAYAVAGSPRFAGEEKKWDEAFRLTATGILKMQEASSKNGAGFAVVLNDRPQTYRPNAYRYLFKVLPGLEKEVDLDLPAKKLHVFLKNRGMEWLDLNPVFKSLYTPRRTGHYVYDGHWSPDGHRWTAEALVGLVKGKVLRAA